MVVTGGTGMVGCYLVAELLASGYDRVTVILREEKSREKLDRFLARRGLSTAGLRFEQVSLFDPVALEKALEGCGLLFHCAAAVSFGERGSQLLVEENVRMAYAVAEAALAASVGRLVHVSSVATLAARPCPELTAEGDYMLSLQDKNPYGVSKFFAENEVWRVSYKGLDAVVVNPAVIIGEGAWRGTGTPAIFRYVRKCSRFYTDGIVGYVGACDVARMMLTLARNADAGGKRFILCAENLSYKRFLGMVAQSVGRKRPFIRIPKGLVETAGKLAGLTGWEAVPRYLLRNLTDRVCYDGRRAAAATGLSYTPMEEVVEAVGRAYLDDEKTN